MYASTTSREYLEVSRQPVDSNVAFLLPRTMTPNAVLL